MNMFYILYVLHIDILYSYNKARDNAKKIIRKEKQESTIFEVFKVM